MNPEYCWLAALLVMTAAGTVGALAVGEAFGVPAAGVLLNYAFVIWLFGPPTVCILLVGVLARAVLKRSRRPIGELKPFLASRLATPSGAAGTLLPILVVPLLMGAFGTLKQVIPLVHPFAWDDTFARADRILFLGVQPWQLTHALLGGPLSTGILDRVYMIWVPLLFIVVLGFAVVAPTQLRARFFLSFGAGWLLIGVVGAFLLSSAGPCYAGAVGASAAADYAPLMKRLHEIHEGGQFLGAVDWQRVLWEAHSKRHFGFGMGISAMPSMHNAITFLYLLAAWRASAPVRLAAALFTGTVFVASIHLGWHYAVDGLAAWAAMGLIWWAAGAFLAWTGAQEREQINGELVPGMAAT